MKQFKSLGSTLLVDPCNRIRNPAKSGCWNPKSTMMEYGIYISFGIRNPMSSEFGIQRVENRNPEGWNPESRGSESGIQMVGIRNPEPLWILLHGSIIRVCFVQFNAFVPPWVNIFVNCGIIKKFTNNYCSLVHCFGKFRSHYLPLFFSKTGTVNTNFVTLSE